MPNIPAQAMLPQNLSQAGPLLLLVAAKLVADLVGNEPVLGLLGRALVALLALAENVLLHPVDACLRMRVSTKSSLRRKVSLIVKDTGWLPRGCEGGEGWR